MSGRGAELYHLFTRAKRAFAGAGVAVVITGESGAGKTSTLDAVQLMTAAAGQPCCASTRR